MYDKQKKNKWLDVILALFFLVPVALVFYQTRTSLEEQGAASGDAMTNAAMFPLLLVSLLGFLAIVQLVLSINQSSECPAFVMDRTVKNSIVFVAFLAIYLIGLPLLGYHLMTPLLCLAMLILLGVAPLPAILIGLALSLLVALFFEGALNVVLPTGYFGLALPI